MPTATPARPRCEAYARNLGYADLDALLRARYQDAIPWSEVGRELGVDRSSVSDWALALGLRRGSSWNVRQHQAAERQKHALRPSGMTPQQFIAHRLRLFKERQWQEADTTPRDAERGAQRGSGGVGEETPAATGDLGT